MYDVLSLNIFSSLKRHLQWLHLLSPLPNPKLRNYVPRLHDDIDSDEESVVPLPPNKKKHMNDGKVKAETTVEAVVSCVR